MNLYSFLQEGHCRVFLSAVDSNGCFQQRLKYFNLLITYSFSRKRRHDDYTRDDTANVLDETAEQNRRNRDYAMTDRTCNDDLAESGMFRLLVSFIVL